ncbi:MAG: peptide MFS transporter [Deltaproteobacteria bacterium]|nr:peptide MFS transporter [Deltaproteobacteria bacterium]
MDTSIEKHPKGLYVLFFSEAWERFSFYGMRALLVLYLVDHLGYTRTDALSVYATYLGLVYLTPLIGGALADRVLGARKAIIIGGTLMAIGHLAMAFESQVFMGMGLIIAGSGFFKPNISTIVGSLYEEGDPRRDGGFTIFYMGINLGAFFAPLVCGWLGEKIGWHFGFSAATIGMVLGITVFILGQGLLGTAGFPPNQTNISSSTRLAQKDWIDVILFVAASIAVVAGILYLWQYVGPFWDSLTWIQKLMAAVFFLLAGKGWNTLSHRKRSEADDGKEPFTREERHRLIVTVIICIFVVFFWMGFEQAGGTMNLFADKQTDRIIFGWEFPASWFQAVNPLFIIMLAPIFSLIWRRNDSWRHGISTPAKMGLGMILLGLGFIVMYFGQQSAAKFGKAGLGWLVIVYLLHTIGELSLSPIGLSLVTKLSPARTVSFMMGIWFAASALADYMAGRLEEILTHFAIPLWPFLIASSCGAGLVLLALTPFLKKWMHEAS